MTEPPSQGCFRHGVHRVTLRIYFEDTDLTGVVYHANYLRLMERGRTEMLRSLGIEAQPLLAAGAGYFAVYDVAVTYLAPARLDDVLVVESRVTQVRAAATVLAQDIWRGTRQLTRGRIVAAWLDMAGRPTRQPRAWSARFTELKLEAEGA